MPETPKKKQIRYSDAIGRRLIALVSECGSVTRACDEIGIRGRWQTVWRWSQSGKTVDGAPLGEAIDQARRDYCATVQDDLAETLRALDDAVKGDASDSARVSALRAKSQGYQWLLSKLLPRLYGDRLEHTGRIEQPVEVHLVQYGGATVDGELVTQALLGAPSGGSDGPRARVVGGERR